MNITDLDDDILNKILNIYMNDICVYNGIRGRCVDDDKWDLFCQACELLLP